MSTHRVFPLWIDIKRRLDGNSSRVSHLNRHQTTFGWQLIVRFPFESTSNNVWMATHRAFPIWVDIKQGLDSNSSRVSHLNRHRKTFGCRLIAHFPFESTSNTTLMSIRRLLSNWVDINKRSARLFWFVNRKKGTLLLFFCKLKEKI